MALHRNEMMRFLKYAGSLALGLILLGPFGLHAQEAYPEKAIKIVVPYPPGGFNDTLGRFVGKKLSDAWGKPVIVENKPGAGTTIGTAQVASAAPDGYTILVNQFPYATNPFLYKNIPYDTRKAFAPVIFAGKSPMVLVVHAESKFKSAGDVIQAAKAAPKSINYGSSGSGSSNHLVMAFFELATNTQLNQIGYKGSTPLLTDLAGGQVVVAFDALPHVMPFIKGGRVRPIAVASAKRSSLMPDIPTLTESGVKGFEASSWHGFVVPAATPPAIIAKLNRQINEILAQDDAKRFFAEQGVTPEGGTPAQYGAFINSQMELWGKVVTDGKITAE